MGGAKRLCRNSEILEQNTMGQDLLPPLEKGVQERYCVCESVSEHNPSELFVIKLLARNTKNSKPKTQNYKGDFQLSGFGL